MYRLTIILACACVILGEIDLSFDKNKQKFTETVRKKRPHTKPPIKPGKRVLEYCKALEDFDDEVFEIKQFLGTTKTLKRFVTLYYIIQAVTMDVTKNGWSKRDERAYTFDENKYKEAATPEEAIDKINCYFNTIGQSFAKLRKVIESDWARRITNDNQTKCNMLIDGLIDLSADKRISHEALVLITAGEVGRKYTEYFTHNLLKWALDTNTKPKELIEFKQTWFKGFVNSEMNVHKLIFSNSISCFSSSNKNYKDTNVVHLRDNSNGETPTNKKLSFSFSVT